MSVRQAPAGLSDTGLTPIDPLPHRADEEKSWPAEQLPLENSHRRASRAPGDLPPSHHLPVLTPQGWPSLDQQQSPALQTTALPPGHALSRQGRSRAGAGQRRQASGHGGQGGGTTALESSNLRCERRRKRGSSRRCRSRQEADIRVLWAPSSPPHSRAQAGRGKAQGRQEQPPRLDVPARPRQGGCEGAGATPRAAAGSPWAEGRGAATAGPHVLPASRRGQGTHLGAAPG